MIEQLWYTWSTSGLGSVTGFRVRAASAGLMDLRSERFRAINPYLHYTLPLGTLLEQAEKKTSPVSLTFADADDTTILVQKVFAGADAYGRIGIYFCHLITAGGLSAREAIELWRSSFWQVSDGEIAPNATHLDGVSPTELLKGPLGRHNLKITQEQLQFVIQAFLSLKEAYQKLYIMAPDDQIAALIWGLTHSLPYSLQEKLTFSTYEYDLSKVTTRIVGTCHPATQILEGYEERVADLPANYYDTRGFALNCYMQNRYSSLPVNPLLSSFAEFAAQALLHGRNIETFEKLLALADEINVKEVDHFLTLYRSFRARPHELSSADITSFLQTPAVALRLLSQENFQQAIRDRALMDPQWWRTEAEQAMVDLEQWVWPEASANSQPHPFAELADLVAHSLRDDENVNRALLLQMLWAIAPPAHNPAPWLMLWQHFSSPGSSRLDPLHGHSWEERKWFLQVWNSLELDFDDAQIAPWLIISLDELPELLSLQLPYKWCGLGIKNLLTTSTTLMPRGLAGSLMKEHSNLLVRVLEEFMRDSQAQTVMHIFFESLMRDGYREIEDLFYTLLSVEGGSPACGDTLLSLVRLSEREKTTIFQRYGLHLVQQREGRAVIPVISEMIKKYIDTMKAPQLAEEETGELLYRLDKLPLQPPLSERVRDWYLASLGTRINGFTSRFLIEASLLAGMGEAIVRLRLHVNQQYMKELRWVLINRVESHDDLVYIVENLGKPLEGTRLQFLLSLAAYRGETYIRLTFKRQVSPMVLLPYIIVAFIYVAKRSEHTRKKYLGDLLPALLKNADAYTYDSLTAALSQLSERGLLEERMLEWWQNFGLPSRPKTAKDRLAKGLKAFGGLLLPLSSARPKKNISVTSPQPDSPDQTGHPSVIDYSQQTDHSSATDHSHQTGYPPAAGYSEPTSSTRQTDSPQFSTSAREDAEQEPTSQPASSPLNIRNYATPIDLEMVVRMVRVRDLFLEWRISLYQNQQNEVFFGSSQSYQPEKEISQLEYLRRGEDLRDKQTRIFNQLVEHSFLLEWLEQDQKKATALKQQVTKDRIAALDFIKKNRKMQFQQLTNTIKQKEIEDMLDICIQRELIPEFYGIKPGDNTWKNITRQQ
jgi:hypothetical protein